MKRIEDQNMKRIEDHNTKQKKRWPKNDWKHK